MQEWLRGYGFTSHDSIRFVGRISPADFQPGWQEQRCNQVFTDSY
jgi:hypothetical protein